MEHAPDIKYAHTIKGKKAYLKGTSLANKIQFKYESVTFTLYQIRAERIFHGREENLSLVHPTIAVAPSNIKFARRSVPRISYDSCLA